MEKKKYYVTTRFIQNSNVRRVWGDTLGYDPDTQTACEGEGLVVGDQIYNVNLATQVYEVAADGTHNNLIGVAVKEFHEVEA